MSNKNLLALVLLMLAAPTFAQDDAPRTRTELGPNTQRSLIIEGLDKPAATPGAEVSVALPVNFEFGSASLTAEGRSILDTTASAFNSPELVGYSFIVEGHTDSVGDVQTNLRLSQRRADAARAYLAAHGVAAARLSAIGYGKSRPIPGVSETDARQRRVEFVRQGG